MAGVAGVVVSIGWIVVRPVRRERDMGCKLPCKTITMRYG